MSNALLPTINIMVTTARAPMYDATLPVFVEDGIRYCIFMTESISGVLGTNVTVNGVNYRPYDIALHSSLGYDTFSDDVGKNHFVSLRHHKTGQYAYIESTAIANKDAYPNLYIIDYTRFNKDAAVKYNTIRSGVFKTEHGASGEGQIYIKDTRLVDMSRLCLALNNSRRDVLKSISDALPDNLYRGNVRNSSREFVEPERGELFDEYDSHEYSRQGGWIFQEYLENITSEWRFVRTPLGSLYGYERERGGDVFKQPRVGDVVNNPYNLRLLNSGEIYDHEIPLHLQAEIQKFVDNMCRLHPTSFLTGSIDIVFHAKGWSVFEFSNEYATKGVPLDSFDKIMRQIFKELATISGLI